MALYPFGSQLEALQLAGLGARQRKPRTRPRADTCRGDVLLDVVLQASFQFLFAFKSRSEHHERLDDHAALLVGHADHAALGDRGMRKQRAFPLRAGDV